MSIKLRKYQNEAVKAVRQEWRAGNLATLLAMATGTGKTETFLALLAETMMGTQDRALILAHRRELIYQPVERIKRHWKVLGRPGIVMAHRDECDARIIVATVQTLSSGSRLNRILVHGPITHLVTDEAHHATADTYVRIYDRLKEARPHLRHVGATATPRRTDQVALEEVYDSVAYRFPISKAIASGALCPFVALGVYVPAKIAELGINSQTGDYSGEAVGRAMTTDAVNRVIVDTWEEKARGKPTIAFCGSVDQAHALVETFLDAGVPASSADYRTDDDTRAGILRGFTDGVIKVIANYGLWTEGVDLPMIECVLQARPTQSGLVYVQAIGRGLRTAPNKESCLIIDFVPEDARDLRMAGDLLEGRPRPERKAVEKAEQNGLILDCFGIDRQGEGIDAPPDELLIKVLDYLGQSRLAWTTAEGYATAGLSDSYTLAVKLGDKEAAERVERAERLMAAGEDLSQWESTLALLRRRAQHKLALVEKKAGVRDLGRFDSWEEVMFEAEGQADLYCTAILGEKKKGWRNQPASDKQRKWLERAGLWTPGMTKGAAAQALTHYWTGKVLRRKAWWMET